jgi:hypothetical protein
MKAKYTSLWTPLFFSAFLLSGGAASADDFGQCSIANVAGAWGYTITGTNTNKANPGADAIVGSGIIKFNGDVVLNQTEVTNGTVYQQTATSTVPLIVKSDCTATLKIKIKLTSGETITTATFELRFVDNQTEIRGILTNLSNVRSPPLDGQPQQLPVQTLNAKKLFPRRF